jgi:hypothetical protein
VDRKLSQIKRHINFANVTSLLALFIALGGATVYAAARIGADDIKPNAVRSKHIKTGAVKRVDIAKNAINGPRIASGAVASADIANESVGAADLGTGSVGGSEILDGSVSAAELGVAPQWLDITYSTGWSAFDATLSSYSPVQCFKDPFDVVHFRGAAERAAAGDFEIGTLPEACRVLPAGTPPSFRVGFTGDAVDSQGTGVGTASMWIRASGDANTIGFDFTPAGAEGDGLSVDGVAIGAR